MRLIEEAKGALLRIRLEFAVAQHRADLQRQLRRKKRQRDLLAAELMEISYDSSPPDWPAWYKEEFSSSFEPLRTGILQVDGEIRQLEDELARL